MTSSFPGATGPAAGAAWHAGEDLLASYAAGTAGAVADWSVEAHLTGCASCRSALSAHVDAERLARNRSALLVRTATGDSGRLRRLLRGCGVPDYVLSLLAATPSLRASWLLSVVAVAAVAAGEAAAVTYGWIPGAGPGHLGWHVGPEALLLPSLALSAFALAAATVIDPRAAAVTTAALWALPALWLASAHVPLLIVAPDAQFACVAMLCACAAVLYLRHDRFELRWMR